MQGQSQRPVAVLPLASVLPRQTALRHSAGTPSQERPVDRHSSDKYAMCINAELGRAVKRAALNRVGSNRLRSAAGRLRHVRCNGLLGRFV